MDKRPKLTHDLNISVVMEYTMAITDKAEADEWFRLIVEWALSFNGEREMLTTEQAIERVRSNIGYWSGYYNPEVQERMRNLFGSYHPFFG